MLDLSFSLVKLSAVCQPSLQIPSKRHLYIPKRLIERQGVQQELIPGMTAQSVLDALAIDMYRCTIGKRKFYEFLVGLKFQCSFIAHVCTKGYSISTTLEEDVTDYKHKSASEGVMLDYSLLTPSKKHKGQPGKAAPHF